MRHRPPPATFAERIVASRFLIARRIVQLGVLLLFFGTAHWGWTVAGRPLLQGDLSAASLAGVVPLADPFAALQVLATGHLPRAEFLIGAAVVLGAWLLLGGRTFCAWACPLDIVTDAAAWLSARLGLRDRSRIPPSARYVLLVLALALSVFAGVAAFEWISPIGLLQRALIYGAAAGWIAVAGVFLLDLALHRRAWCGHLCPLGAFWSLAGRAGLVKVRFAADACTRCGDCVKVCPEPRVLNFVDAARAGCIAPGECTNCARCIAICPEDALVFGIRPFGTTASPSPPPRGSLP